MRVSVQGHGTPRPSSSRLRPQPAARRRRLRIPAKLSTSWAIAYNAVLIFAADSALPHRRVPVFRSDPCARQQPETVALAAPGLERVLILLGAEVVAPHLGAVELLDEARAVLHLTLMHVGVQVGEFQAATRHVVGQLLILPEISSSAAPSTARGNCASAMSHLRDELVDRLKQADALAAIERAKRHQAQLVADLAGKRIEVARRRAEVIVRFRAALQALPAGHVGTELLRAKLAALEEASGKR